MSISPVCTENLNPDAVVMPGKQAKILKAVHIDDLLSLAETTRHPLRDRLIVLLSVKPQSRRGSSRGIKTGAREPIIR